MRVPLRPWCALLANAMLAAPLAFALLNASASALADEPYRYQIVTGDDSAVTRHIVDDLQQRLRDVLPAASGDQSPNKKTITITIGPVALRTQVAHHFDGFVISAYTSSQVCHAILETLAPAHAAAITAVYAEPAPADQLRLIALLYKHPVTVATILSHDTAYLSADLRSAGAEIVIEHFNEGEDLNKVLNGLAKSKVLLAIPDRAVYNTENIRNILLSTYRHNQGVIGFSADMVKAGALASTYSNIEDINEQISEIVLDVAQSGTLPAPQFPRYFQAIVNEGVARSLSVSVDDAAKKFAHHPPAKHP